MKKIIFIFIFLFVFVSIGIKVSNALGSITPSGTAGDDTQYTLNDIYTKLTTGATTTVGTGTVTVPGTVSATFRTLTDIYNAIPVELSIVASTTTVPVGINFATTTLDTIDTDLIASNIKLGANVFGVEGSVVNASDIPGQTLSNSTTSVPYGVYATTTLESVDSDLVAGNIKSGTNLFGVAGTYSVTLGVNKTGATTSSAVATRVCADGGTGVCDDGYYQKGLPSAGARFTDNSNSTISDNVTRLMWTKCLSGYTGSDCSGGSMALTNLVNSISYCEDLSLASNTDWRLPNVVELRSLVDYGVSSPAINTTYFQNFQNTPVVSSTKHPFTVGTNFEINFQYGLNNAVAYTTTRAVMCVRNID